MDRRQFLNSLFGAAVVAAAGPLPKVIEKLSDDVFRQYARLAIDNEIYYNGKDYIFAAVKYLNEPPYITRYVPDGYRPLRAESDRMALEVLSRIGKS